jgi:hypothetical protein
MSKLLCTCLVLVGFSFVIVPTVHAQSQPGARAGDRTIIFVGGKKAITKRKIKRVSPRDQRAINPQPLPPRTP